jgi:hypothetical protein
MNAYLEEAEPMPLDRQLRLAVFVGECVPPLARAGQQLRAQVAAATTHHDRMTESDIRMHVPG